MSNDPTIVHFELDGEHSGHEAMDVIFEAMLKCLVNQEDDHIAKAREHLASVLAKFHQECFDEVIDFLKDGSFPAAMVMLDIIRTVKAKHQAEGGPLKDEQSTGEVIH